MKILLAVDGSASSNQAIAEIIRRPWPEQTEVKVITAYEVPFTAGIEPWAAGPMYFDDVRNAASSAANSVLEHTLTKLRSAPANKLKITGEALQGSPKQVIVEVAEHWGADLIVMGSRGLGTWTRLLLGSVSNAVVHHAKCSVEIVR
ncbi:MAG TPA: universal stress protein [Pyrinomonadaceae bacterium]|nr:universal stress protein [Pyrinomonadaceae bacterium]